MESILNIAMEKINSFGASFATKFPRKINSTATGKIMFTNEME